MATMQEYSLGTPCWFELGTTDQPAAKRFYCELFGWTAQDNPMGEAGVYTMLRLDGRDVGAVCGMPPVRLQRGDRAHWGVYFATPDIGRSAARVTELGGAVDQGPFDVADFGRMAICKDPGGAWFSLWQARSHIGATALNENGAVCWCELASWDVPQARAFYTALFGWETKGAASMETYIEFSAGGQPRGGLLPMDDHWKGIPSHWGVYFRVADCDAVAARAKDLGATVRYGPFTAPGVGRMALLADPQGAGFSIITLAAAQ